MNIILSMYSHWSQMILDGKKPLEFRTRLPKDFHAGDTVYLYETAKYHGARAVVGECIVDDIIPMLSPDGKYPLYGAYPFITYWLEHIKGDKAMADKYRELQKEAVAYTNYRYGFILGYAQSDAELQSLRSTGSLLDLWELDPQHAAPILRDNEVSKNLIGQCDEWLSTIGLYNDYEETSYRYGIVLKDAKRYNAAVPISAFADQNGNPITRPPQSWMYTLQK